MQPRKIGDVTITSLIERDGPWRKPEDMFPAYDPVAGKRYLAELDPVVFAPARANLLTSYYLFAGRPPKHPVLIAPCPGENRAPPPPMFIPNQPWLDNF